MNYSYKIHVINRDLNLDKTYKNVVQVFNPLTRTKDYTSVFTNAELTFDETDSEINFELKDGVNASVVLDLQPAESEEEEIANIYKQFGVTSLSIKDALSRQYAIVQEREIDDNGNVQKTNMYFYFITDYNVINSYTIKYTLELDVFMTYPLYSDIEVNKTKILRAHVNRFDLGATANSATHLLTSKYLETGEPYDNEFIKVRQPIINKEFVQNLSFKQLNDAMNLMALKRVLTQTLWLYVIRRTEDTNYPNEIYCAPLEADANYFVSTDDTQANWKTLNAKTLYNALAEDANVINAFISPLSPYGSYQNDTITTAYTAYSYNSQTGVLNIIFVNPSNAIYNYKNRDFEGARVIGYGYVNGAIRFLLGNFNNLKTYIASHQTESFELFNKTNSYINIPFDYDVIKKAEIKTKMRQCYNEYKLKTQLDDSELLLDLVYLKTNELKIQAYNNISAENSGEIFLTCNDLYSKRFGSYTKAQYTPTFFSDKFNEYKATNKNFALTGIATPIFAGAIGGAIGGAKAGPVGALVGGAIGAVGAGIKTYTNYDNMINSPDSIKYKGQSASLDNFINDYFFYIEHSELRKEEMQAVNMYLYEYGYTINEVADISEFFTRSSFNFIQTEDCEKDLHALINKNVLDTIIKALNNGVRFWTTWHYAHSKFAYTTNNLENELNT